MNSLTKRENFWIMVLAGFCTMPLILIAVVYPTVLMLKLIISTAFGLETHKPTTAHKTPTTIEEVIKQDKGKASDCLY
ncbi:hypothetical protein [Bartonella sp. DGB2]|uniref:hypothetical protein n=1 Tax=Bartonella sp. DGB2 TaxID=3388426 RepID=UPI003990071A